MTKPITRTQFLDRHQQVDVDTSMTAVKSVLALNANNTSGDGRLAGIAIAIKDNIECVGLPGSAGSLALAEHPAVRDAELVTALKAAGADIVAATNLSEWANLRSTHATSGWSAVGGLTGNPWQLDRSAGGSSSGAGAAVAAGLVSIAIGSETDGSIVCPAAFNGVVGLKPTVGLVSVQGVVPISKSQDTPGPLATTVALTALAFEVMTGRDDAVAAVNSATSIVGSLKIGVAENWLTGHAATDAIFDKTLAVIGGLVGQLATSNVPLADDQVGQDEYTVMKSEVFDDMATYLIDRLGTGPLNSLQDIVDFNRANAETELRYFDQDIFEAAVATRGRAGRDYAAARRRNLEWALRKCLSPAFNRHDLLIAPAYGPAWKSDLTLGDQPVGGAVTCAAAIAGLPLLCVPMGLVNGLPVGITISGPANSEASMLALGAVLEANLGCRVEDGFVAPMAMPIRG